MQDGKRKEQKAHLGWWWVRVYNASVHERYIQNFNTTTQTELNTNSCGLLIDYTILTSTTIT